MVDGTGKTSYTYDADGRLTAATDGAGHTTGYTYDNADRLTKLDLPRDPRRGQLRLQHPGPESPRSPTGPPTSPPSATTTTGPTTVAYPNTVTDTYTYDNAERLTNIADTPRPRPWPASATATTSQPTDHRYHHR